MNKKNYYNVSWLTRLCCVWLLLTFIPGRGVFSMPTNETRELLQELSITGVNEVTGTVKDDRGEPLPGVNVMIKGTQTGTSTDATGRFSIRVTQENAVLIFSFVGYQTQEITPGSQRVLDVTLLPDQKSLEEVVVIGYGTQKKTSLTAAVSTIGGDELSNLPIGELSNGLGGRLSGVINRQVSGQPGNDGANIYIRGIATTGSSAPLLIVDGIPRNYSQLDPNNIASFTVLKDAAAVAPYGVAGANGVILVTTKKGESGKSTISYNGYYGMQNPTFLPDFVNLEQYAELQNQIARNAGAPIPWTPDRLELHLSGRDPDRYPNWDVFGTLIDKNAPITNHTLEFSGGSNDIRYYTSLGWQRQNGMWKTDYQNKYTLTTNLDFQATKTTRISVGINGIIRRHTQPAIGERVGQGPEYIMQLFSYAHPDQPLIFSNGTYGNYMGPAIFESGYKRTNATTIYTKLSIDQELNFLKGLKAGMNLAFDPSTTTIKAWQTPTYIYTLDTSKDPYEYIPGAWGPTTPTLNETFQNTNQLTWQGNLTYEKSLGKNYISVLAVMETRENKFRTFTAGRRNYSVFIDELNLGSSAAVDISNGGTSSQARQMGFVYRIAYDYNNKLLLETSGRYDGHYYFAPNKRWGFFPSVSLGWRISEEDFFRNNVPWVANLKLRGSYGEVGALAGGPFQYLSMYNAYGPAYAFNGSALTGINERSESNPNITWERARKTNLGFELSILKQLNIEFDYFYEKRSNMLVAPNVIIPVEYGIGLSQVNAGVMSNKGIDLTLQYNQEIARDLTFSFHGTFTYARNKLLQIFENAATYDNPNRRLTGRPLGVEFGYRALGYFKPEDFNADGSLVEGIASQPWDQVQPGDLRYDDVNKDGKIDVNDYVQIGRSRIPEIIYGFTPGIKFKGLELNLLFQGAANANFRLHGAGAWPFWGGRAAYVSHLDNWTPENPDARYPRIVSGQTANNQQPSSWWVENTSYLRIKSATLQYTLPPLVTQALRIQRAVVYMSGQNLHTWTSVINFDPEMNNTQSWDYPQQKVLSFGINLTF